jgi:death-on-curing protein
MRYLTLSALLRLYRRVMQQSGGAIGLRDLGALEAVLAQPRMTFGGQELYPTPVEKAAALGFSLVRGHPFIDGNKRIGHAAMETFLLLNGFEIEAPVDEQEQLILRLAAGELEREELEDWLRRHIVERR